MWRVVIIFKNGAKPVGVNFNTKDEAEDYILKESDKQEIRRADLLNKDTGERERVF